MKNSIPSLKNDLMLRAINHQAVERVPVWMMRQAGRSDPEYRKIRARDQRPLEQLFADPEIAVQISLLPKRFGVDAIIFYQDILTPLTPMGAEFVFIPGPHLHQPIRSLSDVKRLKSIDPESQLPFIGATLRGLLQELNQELPLLGFAGAPLTLAFFMLAGVSPSAHYSLIFEFIESQPKVFEQLIAKLTQMTIEYLHYQIDNGVHAIQLFESVADVLPEEIYKRYALPSHQEIFAHLSSKVPCILFAKECRFYDLMMQSGAQVLSIGSSIDLKIAHQQAQGKFALQGNVDNRLLRDGNQEQIQQAIQNCLHATQGKGHILNLNHGLLPDTPFQNVLAFVKLAQEYGTLEKRG